MNAEHTHSPEPNNRADRFLVDDAGQANASHCGTDAPYQSERGWYDSVDLFELVIVALVAVLAVWMLAMLLGNYVALQR